jgi:hypothetical protein
MRSNYGVGRTVISCQTESEGRLDLLRFPDGSLAVRRDDEMIGVWPASELAAGVNAYCDLAGIGRHRDPGAPPDLIVLLRTDPLHQHSNN